MSASGNTDFISVDESSNAIFTDTFIDEDASNDDTNYSTGNKIFLDSTSSNVQAGIIDISVPTIENLVDSNGNA